MRNLPMSECLTSWPRSRGYAKTLHGLAATRTTSRFLESLAALSNPALFSLEESDLPKAVFDELWSWGIDRSLAEKFILAYHESHPTCSASECFVGIYTAVLRDDAITQAERKSIQGRASSYVYEFSWTSQAFKGHYGSSHTFEIPFVFQNLSAASQLFDPVADEETRTLASRMSTAWATFAYSGNPGSPGLPTWLPYTCESRNTMLFDRVCELVQDPRSSERRSFERLREARIKAMTTVKPKG